MVLPQKIGVERMFVIDTSALIDIRRWYPPDVFPQVWRNMEAMIQRGEVEAPIEVLREVEDGDDELKVWCRNHKEMFVDIEEDLNAINIFMGVQKKYDKKEWEKNIQKKHWADPWVVTLAICRVYINEEGKNHPIIVTSENQVKPNKIPTIAREFGINSIKVPEFMKYVLGGSNGG